MTQEEKAKAYDEALEKAKKLQENSILKKWLLHIFPELKENEDERIRKLLISGMKHLNYTAETFASIPIKDAIDWLEKQGKQDTDISSFPEEQQMFMRKYVSLDKITLIKLLAERDANNAEIIESFEKQSNQKPYGQRAECLDCQFNYAGECKGSCAMKRIEQKPIKVMKSPEESLGISSKEYNDIVNDCIYGESKSTDNIEPKFHEGDWVVCDCEGFRSPLIIVSVSNIEYRVEDVQGNSGVPKIEYLDRHYHLWSIQDAKDGDVLFHSDSASNGVFIFKEIIDRGFAKEVVCYCDYDSEDHFCLGKHHTCCWTNAKILRPATKEQRDALMKAMADASYTFDFEKKELKKIGNRPMLSDFFNAEYERGKADAISEIRKGWTEDDKNHMANILNILSIEAKNAQVEQYRSSVESDIDWLKSLKNKYKNKSNI